jgi:hypothetical protein
MLDGRIDTQGTITDLQRQGILNEIAMEARKEGIAEGGNSNDNSDAEDDKGIEKDKTGDKGKKEVRKLIEEEKIAEGRVRFSVYQSYLKAS